MNDERKQAYQECLDIAKDFEGWFRKEYESKCFSAHLQGGKVAAAGIAKRIEGLIRQLEEEGDVPD